MILCSAIVVIVVFGRSGVPGATIPRVSAVTAEQNLGVYWDGYCTSTEAVNTIDWGILMPGQVREVVVYVRNQGNDTFVLVLMPLNWNPENASQYLSLVLNCEDTKIEVGQVAAVTLRLSVSPSITGVYDFGFDIVLEGREFFPGDLNRDGSVGISDISALTAAMGSAPTDSHWNLRADLKRDGVIDVFDLLLLSQNFGRSW